MKVRLRPNRLHHGGQGRPTNAAFKAFSFFSSSAIPSLPLLPPFSLSFFFSLSLSPRSVSSVGAGLRSGHGLRESIIAAAVFEAAA